MIREYMNREIPTEYAYMLTGTYGQKILMNRDPDTSDYPGKKSFSSLFLMLTVIFRKERCQTSISLLACILLRGPIIRNNLLLGVCSN